MRHLEASADSTYEKMSSWPVVSTFAGTADVPPSRDVVRPISLLGSASAVLANTETDNVPPSTLPVPANVETTGRLNILSYVESADASN